MTTSLLHHRALALALIAVFTLPNIAFAQKSAKFDPDGSFWILGEPPTDFKDFGGINLNAKRLRRLNKPGVNLTNGAQLRFLTLAVTHEKLVFTTAAGKGGVSYNFNGRFLKAGVFAAANLDDQTPVLEGLLTKLKNGQKVADARLKFVYFGGT